MADFLGFKGEPRGIEYVQKLEPKKRQLFERMATLERDVQEAIAGRAPWPHGVLIDTPRRR